jgi:RNA-directed DNA polymerase
MPRVSKPAQYLGFLFDEAGPTLRESSLSRQWRKMRRAIRKTRKIGLAKIKSGKSATIHTKRLNRRFSNIKICDNGTIKSLRNFSSYARRSAEAFGDGTRIVAQIRRLESTAQKEIAALKAKDTI